MSSAMQIDRKWLVAAGVLLAAGLVAAVELGRGSPVQYVTAKVLRGEIRDVVEATGTVNAVITVQVGSQVSGTIARLNADFNSRVHRGEVIALIEPALFRGALQQASADLESAQANVAAAEANLGKASAVLAQTQAQYEREVPLVDEKLESREVLDIARSNYEVAKATVAGAEASIAQARAQVKQKEAAVAVARTNLGYTEIRSPIDGIVVARNVDVGQTVAASLQAPTIFTIAQDLTKMLLYAKTDESDVGRIKVGQPVTFKVDAFPKDLFHGVVRQMRMNGTTVQNVVTYDAIIDFANPEVKLFPGMTAYVTIPVATVQNVVKLPNTALRFKPPLSPETMRVLYAKYHVDDEPAPTGAAGSASGSEPATRGPRRDYAVIWKLRPNKSLQPVKITLGITDHAYTEVASVIAGELTVDDEVVTAFVASKSSAPGVSGVRR